MVPPSEGVFSERLHWFLVTEAGPLALFFISMGEGDYVFAGVISAVIVLLVILWACMPRRKPLTIAACLGILLWFFFGFSVAGLRIT
jgi:hypothetical protein